MKNLKTPIVPILLAALMMLISCNSSPSSPEPWQTIQINKYAKVDFPETPKVMQLAGQTVYYLKETKDSTSAFMVMVADTLNVPNSEVDGFYNDMIRSALGMVSGELISVKEFVIDSFSGREILFTRHLNESLLSKSRILYCHNSSYVYGHLFTTKKTLDTVAEKRFFESFALSSGK